MANNAKYGKLLWGSGTWASNATSSVILSATFTGSTTFTAGLVVTLVALFKGAAQLMQAITGLFLAQGVFNQPRTCGLDSTLILYNVPRATVAVTMPIAYVTSTNRMTDAVLCSPNTTTVPVTGSLSTIIEGNDGESLNN